MALASVARLVGSSSHTLKGHWFDSPSGHRPRLWVRSPVRACMTRQPVDLSFSLSSSLPLCPPPPSPLSKSNEKWLRVRMKRDASRKLCNSVLCDFWNGSTYCLLHCGDWHIYIWFSSNKMYLGHSCLKLPLFRSHFTELSRGELFYKLIEALYESAFHGQIFTEWKLACN